MIIPHIPIHRKIVRIVCSKNLVGVFSSILYNVISFSYKKNYVVYCLRFFCFLFFTFCFESLVVFVCRGTCQHRSYFVVWFVGRLALDIGFCTGLAYCRWAGRARLGLWALNNRAPCARAWRAFADFTGLGARGNTRGATGYRCF